MTTASAYLDMLQARRRYNLRRLIGEEVHRVFAKRAGIDQGQLSNILAGKLPFTEYRARRIEQFTGYPFGVLDLITN